MIVSGSGSPRQERQTSLLKSRLWEEMRVETVILLCSSSHHSAEGYSGRVEKEEEEGGS